MKKLACVVLYFFLVLASAVYAADDSNLVLYLPFDEGNGDVAADLSGNGFNGAITDAIWVEGKTGKALEFNGTSTSKVIVPPLGDPLEMFSLAFWFKPAADMEAGNGRQDMLYKATAAGAPHVSFDREKDGTIGFYTRVKTGDTRVNINVNTVTNSWEAGTWYHVAATQSVDKIAIYINGELEAELDTPNQDVAVADWGTDGLAVGAGTSMFFSGSIDELKIWNATLSADEVAALLEVPSTVESTGKLSVTWGSIKTGL